MRTLTLTAAALAVLAVPAMARDRVKPVFDDSNSHYLDYKTSIDRQPMRPFSIDGEQCGAQQSIAAHEIIPHCNICIVKPCCDVEFFQDRIDRPSLDDRGDLRSFNRGF